MIKYLPYIENLVKIGPADFEIICLKYLFLEKCGVQAFARRIKMNSPILTILTLKLVAIATSFEPSEMGIKSIIYDQNLPYK